MSIILLGIAADWQKRYSSDGCVRTMWRSEELKTWEGDDGWMDAEDGRRAGTGRQYPWKGSQDKGPFSGTAPIKNHPIH